jgi:predicted YcjX-like family ATPase
MRENLHLGVTGLRRTGKTVFLTSLIYQLTQLGSKNLSRFETSGVTLRPATICYPANGKLQLFPYDKILADLRAETPTWPPPTDREFEITLQFNYQKVTVHTLGTHEK